MFHAIGGASPRLIAHLLFLLLFAVNLQQVSLSAGLPDPGIYSGLP
jgi:hypothetical protein